MERRTFIGAVTGASLGLLLEHPVNGSSRAFRNHDFGASLRKRAGNSDGARLPAHKPDVAILAPKLAENHIVICVDLRAYGGSGIPASTDDTTFPISSVPWLRNWLR
jgi:hypothetical protein